MKIYIDMNVKKLKEALANLPDDMEVVLQKDPEGNGHSPLSGADGNAVFIKEDNEVYFLKWSASDCCMTEDEYNKMKSRPKALILIPKY